MLRWHIVFISIFIAIVCPAQFYPASTADWCIFDGGYPLGPNDSPNRNLTMEEDADTLISGQSYQRIEQYNYYDFSDSWYYATTYYVRSEPSGKGYLYFPDSAAEYLTGDLQAPAGDTVHDVLVLYQDPGCGWDLQVTDAIVDSIVTLTYSGVTVQRHYVHTPCFNSANVNFIPDWSFWQASYGASNGPYLTYSDLLAPVGPACVVADGVFVYSVWSEPQGMPGTPCNCPDVDLGIAEFNRSESAHATPNPSTGLFHLGQAADHISVYNAQGRLLFRQHGNEVDLSAYPPGVYTAVVETAKGNSVLRLVVMR